MAESCHTAAKKGGVWDEDGGPAELLCIEDATTADLIEILRTAGIDDDADLVDSRIDEATRIVPDLPPKSPLTETDDETSEIVGGEATQKDARLPKRANASIGTSPLKALNDPFRHLSKSLRRSSMKNTWTPFIMHMSDGDASS